MSNPVPTPPLSVAHVVLRLDPGGLERVVLDLLRQGRRLGQRTAVVCLEQPGSLAPLAEQLGATMLCVHKDVGLRPGVIGRLKTTFAGWRPDVVHTHQIGALLYAGPAARRAGVPVIVHTEHGKHYGVRRRMRWLGWAAAHLAGRYFCVSADIAAEVTAHGIAPGRKVAVVPNGIDTRRAMAADTRAELRARLGIPLEAAVVGTVGRLAEIKRHDLLLRAFARIRPRFPGSRLLLVGDGPLRDELRRLANDLGLASAVHFLGYQEQPEQFLQVLDVFALTSRSEGMPLVVLEAWSAGLPVVASRVGGLPEMIDSQTGILFPFGDETALEAALVSLLSNKGQAQQMGEAGRRRVRAYYDAAIMADVYQRHYLELLARHGGAIRCAS